MTNEELVALIQSGERARMGELWEQAERFVSRQAGKRARALNGFGGVTEEDLYQSGYLALVAAVDSFDRRYRAGWRGAELLSPLQKKHITRGENR